MSRLNYQQVAKLAYDAGWRGKDAQTAVAIARAESQFDTMATRFRGKDYSFGLWQINMKDPMGPERRTKFGISANEQLFDPATNARAAYIIWKDRGGFTDWSTFNDRKFTLYLNGAVFAVKQIEQGKTGIEIPSYTLPGPGGKDDTWGSQKVVDNPISGITDAAKAVADFVTNKENWFRVAAVIGGALLVVLALYILVGEALLDKVLSRIGKVGKVAKAVT